jgi:hypothetical protein
VLGGSLRRAWIVADAAFASDHEGAWTRVIDLTPSIRGRSVVLEGSPADAAFRAASRRSRR